MDKINELTDKQLEQLDLHREKWLKIGMSTGKADIEKAKPNINMIYAKLGESPPYLWSIESPLMANIIINILNKNNLGANLKDNIRVNLCNLDANLWNNLGVNLKDNIRVNLWANLGANLRDNLRVNLWANLDANLWNNLGVNLKDNIRVNLGDDLLYIPTPFWGSLDAYWIAYYLYPHQYIRPMHTDEQMEILNLWAELAQSVFFWYPYKNICVISDRPAEIHKDNRGRLHNNNGASISFLDGWKLYHVHGVEIPAWIIETPEQLSVDNILHKKFVG